MIVVKLFGGLGNQLFQYSTAKSLALKFNTELYLDVSWFYRKTKATHRNYELNNFSISGKLPDQNLGTKLALYNNRFLKYLPIHRKLKKVKENFFYYDESFNSIKDNIYLDGYWQSYKYFGDSRSVLLEEFKSKNNLTTNQDIKRRIISDNSSVAVHIRRTDYLSNPYYHVCSLEYYRKAVAKIYETIKNPTFYVFSDDFEYVSQNINFGNNTEYIGQKYGINLPTEDLQLMSMCSNQIIANSSFSWWAAWLNTNPDKIVIAPAQWFTDETINTRDLCPPNWLKL